MSRALPDLDETTRRYVERLGLALRSRLGDGLVSLVLYGSRARGTHRDDSDIDVLIVIEGLELYGEADARRAHADAAFAVEHVRDALLPDEPS